jgi:hypothetical protein
MRSGPRPPSTYGAGWWADPAARLHGNGRNYAGWAASNRTTATAANTVDKLSQACCICHNFEQPFGKIAGMDSSAALRERN